MIPACENRPFYLLISDNKLLAQDLIFSDQDFAILGDISDGTWVSEALADLVNFLVLSSTQLKKNLQVIQKAENML